MQHSHKITIDPTRLARLFSGEVHLRRGGGKGINGKFDACFMNAAHWLDGGDGSSDKPECVDPVIRNFGVRLNDASNFSAFRDELIPFTPKVLGTNVSKELTEKRKYMCIDWVVRVIVPLAFEGWASRSTKNEIVAFGWAAKLRSLPAIVDNESAVSARAVVLKAKAAAAAYAAAATADAAAYAATATAYAADAADAAATAYAAYAAAATADAADAATAYAADAADAAAAAYAATATKRKIWDASLVFLTALIEAKEDF